MEQKSVKTDVKTDVKTGVNASVKTSNICRRSIRAEDICQRYPGCYPVVIQPYDRRSPPINHNKFVVSKMSKMPDIIREIRQRTSGIRPEDAIFVFIGNTNVIPPISATIEELYAKYKDNNGFLNFTYTIENTFG